MKTVLLSFLQTRRHFVLYCGIGVVGATLDYLSFLVLVNLLAAHYLVANIISTSAGIVTSFLLNSHFNFKVRDRWWSRLAVFYCVGLAGMAVSSLILFVAVSRLQANASAAKLFAIVIVVFLQYNLNRLISFKK